MAPPIVSFISRKNSGKTTLLEKLIPLLVRRGYKLGIIKHDTHGFDIDHPGKDSWRHKQAGAATVAISCPWKLSLIKDVEKEMSLERIAAEFFPDVDLVITEGYKKARKPQIEVFRTAIAPMPMCATQKNPHLIGLVSDKMMDLGVPCIDLEAVESLADFLENRFLKQE